MVFGYERNSAVVDLGFEVVGRLFQGKILPSRFCDVETTEPSKYSMTVARITDQYITAALNAPRGRLRQVAGFAKAAVFINQTSLEGGLARGVCGRVSD